MPISKSIQYIPDRGYKKENTDILELEKQIIKLGKRNKPNKESTQK